MIAYCTSKNAPLIIAIIIVVPVAFIYGFQPNLCFDVALQSTDENNIFKAIMGLYLAFASLWLLGIINSKYWQAAIVSNIFFMFGLAFGRIISVISDGIPSTIFVLGTFGELVLGFYAMYVLKKSSKHLKES